MRTIFRWGEFESRSFISTDPCVARRIVPTLLCESLANCSAALCALTAASSIIAPYFIVKPPRQEPAHAEHVDGGAKSAVTQTILALAETARPMVYGNFH